MYNLEIEKAVDSIKKNKAKRILLQFPDGLKPKAGEVQKILQQKTSAEILIWAGSCFGACDVPKEHSKKLDVDMIIQWGHSEWK